MPRLVSIWAMRCSGAPRSVALPSGCASRAMHQPAQVARPVAGRHVLADLVVERGQADRVALREQEVGQRRRERAGVLRFRVAAGAVAHRPAVVDQQVAAEVRLVLEFLDEVPVAAGEDPPVDVARIVAPRVLAVLGELDGEAVIGTAVNPFPEPLDDRLGAQLHRLDLHQGGRIDHARRRVCDWDGIAASLTSSAFSFTASSRRSMRPSTITPSASAR